MAVESRNHQKKLPEVGVSQSVLEIMQSLIWRTECSELHLSIKSTKKPKPLNSSDMWSHIKVTSSSKSELNFLKDVAVHPRGYLYDLLVAMEEIEDESHLCIQQPFIIQHHDDTDQSQSSSAFTNSSNSRPGYRQQNFKLQHGILRVQEETSREKETIYTTLYLRVCTSFLQMLIDGKALLKAMTLIQIFQPKIEMSFTMKVGEAISKCHLRVKSIHTSLAPYGDVLNDAHFLLHHFTDKLCRFTAVHPNATTEQSESFEFPVSISIQEGRPGWLQVVGVSQYIAIEPAPFALVMLTVFGLGCMPMNISKSGIRKLLGNLDWSKYGLKLGTDELDSDETVYQCRAELKPRRGEKEPWSFVLFFYLHITAVHDSTSYTDMQDFRSIQDNISTIVKEGQQSLVKCLNNSLDKVLQPVKAKQKTQVLVKRCIQSASKGIADIVSMSTNEEFRQQVTDLLKLPDTSILQSTLADSLTRISQLRHQGVWSGSSINKNWQIGSQTASSQDQMKTQIVDQTSNPADEIHTDNDLENCEIPKVASETNNATNNATDMNETRAEEDFAKVLSVLEDPLNLIPEHNRVDHEKDGLKLTESGVKVITDTSDVPNGLIEKSKEKHDQLTPKLPVEAETAEPDLSPFHQLLSPNVNLEMTTPNLYKISENPNPMKAMTSPFHQLAVTPSPKIPVDLTPDIAKITAGMEQVSPFIEIARDGIDRGEFVGLDSMQEDPNGDIAKMNDMEKTELRSYIAMDYEAEDLFLESAKLKNDLPMGDQLKHTRKGENQTVVQWKILDQLSKGKELDKISETDFESKATLDKGTDVSNNLRKGNQIKNATDNNKTDDPNSKMFKCTTGKGDFDEFDIDEFSETFDIVSDLIDGMHDENDTNDGLNDSSIRRNEANGMVDDLVDMDKVKESKDKEVVSLDENKANAPEQQVTDDSDDWFNDVLMEVENWLH